jgi:hypothetical protein
MVARMHIWHNKQQYSTQYFIELSKMMMKKNGGLDVASIIDFDFVT